MCCTAPLHRNAFHGITMHFEAFRLFSSRCCDDIAAAAAADVDTLLLATHQYDDGDDDDERPLSSWLH